MKSHLFFTKRVAKPVDVKRSFTRTRGDRSHLWLISGPSTSKQLLHWYFSPPPPPPPPEWYFVEMERWRLDFAIAAVDSENPLRCRVGLFPSLRNDFQRGNSRDSTFHFTGCPGSVPLQELEDSRGEEPSGKSKWKWMKWVDFFSLAYFNQLI